jgi:hypothetical protein
VLGAVVLAVTGVEALYADMGHFGRRSDPPRVVRGRPPGAARELFRPGRADPPRAGSRPESLLHAGTARAALSVAGPGTLAAIVASQALISGAFSLVQQAIQLGYSPRLTIIHTSRSEYGQIYIPEVNARPGARLLCSGGLVPLVERARRRLRHRRDRHDDDDHLAVVRDRAAALAVVPAAGVHRGRAGF